MHRTRLATALLASIVVLALPLATALAQGLPYETTTHDLSFQFPQGWLLNEQVGSDGLLTVELHHPTGGGAIVVAATVMTPTDRAYWSQPGQALLDDVWTGFRPEVPGAQQQQRYAIDVTQLRGHALDYASEQVAGTIVVAVGPVAAYTIISAADRERLADVQNALEMVVRSFIPPTVARGDHIMHPRDATTPDAPANPLDQAPTGPGGGTPGANPLDPPGGSNPLDPPGGANPLDPPGGANPLDPPGGANPLDPPGGANPLDPPAAPATNPLERTAPPVVDPFVGRFADPDVTLVLEPSGGGYVGEIVVLGAPYPVSATLVDGRLDGAFRGSTQSFAFSAELTGDTLVLESDGARFVLQRRP